MTAAADGKGVEGEFIWINLILNSDKETIDQQSDRGDIVIKDSKTHEFYTREERSIIKFKIQKRPLKISICINFHDGISIDMDAGSQSSGVIR